MATSELNLGWNNDCESQRIWINIDSWDYKVSIGSFKGHSELIQFEGVVANTSTLPGLSVTGDIEIATEVLYPELEEQPPDDHGTFHLIEEGSRHSIGVTLLVAPESFAALFRVFSAAFGNNGSLGLQLYLKHSKGGEPNFWRTGWQHELIQVASFGFGSGGYLRQHPKGGA